MPTLLSTSKIIRLTFMENQLKNIHRTNLTTLNTFSNWSDYKIYYEKEIPKHFYFKHEYIHKIFNRSEVKRYAAVDIYKPTGELYDTRWVTKEALLEIIRDGYLCLPCEDFDKSETIWECMELEWFLKEESNDIRETNESLWNWLHSGI